MDITNGKVDAYVVITDFARGIDHIDLGSVIPAMAVGLNAFVGTATSLEQALINVSSHVASNGTGLFDYAGDSYIYHQDATVGVNTGDGLIKLAGVTALSVVTGNAVGDIHYG